MEYFLELVKKRQSLKKDRKMKKIYVLLAFVLLLGACGLTKEDLGMARSKPDETQVSARDK